MDQFLKSLLKALKGFWIKLFANVITDDEKLCRYIFSKREFSVKNGVKYNAFLPHNGETSVFRTCVPKLCKLTDHQIWNIGINHVAVLSKRDLKARADFDAKCVNEHEIISVMPETSTHHLHANLINWPNEKHERMKIALMLVDNSKFKQLP